MPDFQPHLFDPVACRQEVKELQALLDSSADLAETAFHEFFEPRVHLRALVGPYNSNLISPDLLAWQYPIFGEFRCDFAIGDSARKAFTFVEFEDAGPKSLFVKQGDRASRAWSPRFEGGYSQLIDWFYKLHAMTNTPDMESRLGGRAVRYTGVLIIGRDQHLQVGEKLRMEWRRDHAVVNSRQIVCITYDELLRDLLFRLDQYTVAGAAGG